MENLVSVITPCYNDGAYIEEAIESIYKQSYKNIEIIIIDDGSDDEATLEVLRKLNGPQIIKLKTNHLKPAGARNFGISYAKGKYILPLDSDDIIEPDYIEKAVKVLTNNPNIGAVYCLADLFGTETGHWDLPNYSLESMLLDNIVFVTALFYREDWEKVGGFNIDMDLGMEDYDFWLSILELNKQIYQIPEVLFHYRIKNISRTTRFQDNNLQVKEMYRRIYKNHPKLYEIYKDEYAIILRDALIEQIFIRRKYENRLQTIQKCNDIPFLGFILKKILREE